MLSFTDVWVIKFLHLVLNFRQELMEEAESAPFGGISHERTMITENPPLVDMASGDRVMEPQVCNDTSVCRTCIFQPNCELSSPGEQGRETRHRIFIKRNSKAKSELQASSRTSEVCRSEQDDRITANVRRTAAQRTPG